jgi:hypothetical protein
MTFAYCRCGNTTGVGYFSVHFNINDANCSPMLHKALLRNHMLEWGVKDIFTWINWGFSSATVIAKRRKYHFSLVQRELFQPLDFFFLSRMG